MLFLTTILFVTFAKIQWQLAADLSLADVLTAGFLVVVLWDRAERADTRLTRTSAVAFAFFAAFLLLYLAGFFNLDTQQALTQWTKGMFKFVLHFGFLVAGVTLLGRRSHRFYWYALGAFCGGIALNAVYGIVQLFVAELGGNLDSILIQPITGRDTSINIFGAVNGKSIFRPNGLTGDPNHLGIELLIPLLVLTPALPTARGASPAEDAARRVPRLLPHRRDRHHLEERLPRARLRCADPRDPVPALPEDLRLLDPVRRGDPDHRDDRRRPSRLLRARLPCAHADLESRSVAALPRVRVHPGRAPRCTRCSASA